MLGPFLASFLCLHHQAFQNYFWNFPTLCLPQCPLTWRFAFCNTAVLPPKGTTKLTYISKLEEATCQECRNLWWEGGQVLCAREGLNRRSCCVVFGFLVVKSNVNQEGFNIFWCDFEKSFRPPASTLMFLYCPSSAQYVGDGGSFLNHKSYHITLLLKIP